MGAPNITIAFYEQANATIARGDKGIMAMILREDLPGEVGKEIELGGRPATDLIGDGVSILADGSVVGPIKHLNDYTQFSESEKEGWFFPIRLDEKYRGKSKCRRVSGSPGQQRSNPDDTDWIVRLTDGADTVYEFTADDDPEPFLTLNFRQATLLADNQDAAGAAPVPKANRYKILDATDIPETLSGPNRTQIQKALLGYQTAPKKILAAVIADAEDYADALAGLSADDWDYLVCPSVETDGKEEEIVSWIKNQRDNNHKIYKAVLPEREADYEGIINVANGYTDADGNVFTPEQCCARVAGILCGTPWSISCTYAPLTDAVMCDILEPDELDEAVDAGKLVFMWDGEKAKICRGVNSFVTAVQGKGDSFKKIKLVETMDLIQSDIRKTAQDTYIGKYANTYDNKCLLVTAVNGYFDTLVRDNILESGVCEIDVDAHRTYIKSKGGKFVVDGETVDLEDATEQQIRRANTGSEVFLRATVSMIDAIEDITLNIYL